MKSQNRNIDTGALIHEKSEYNVELSAFLDAARWISALSVLVTHLNNRMFIALAEIPAESRNSASYIWGFICGFAHWGVVIFFVLSGFLVGGPVLKVALNNQDFNARRYIVARVTRIYLVLIPVLIIGNTLDFLGIHLFFQSGVYDEAMPRIIRQSISTLIGSILNLQGLFFDTLGTNGPLGTLANEFWYYMTFPLLLAPILYKKTLKGWFLFGIGVCLFLFMSLASRWHFVGFILWCIGAVFSVYKKPLMHSPSTAFYLFLMVIVLVRLGVRAPIIFGPFGFVFEIVIALLFVNVLCSLRFNRTNWVILKWSGHKRLGGFSYSLYAMHASLLTFMCAALKTNLNYGWHDVPRVGYQWLTAAIFLAICISAAWALSLLTEKHTYRVRNFINNKIAS